MQKHTWIHTYSDTQSHIYCDEHTTCIHLYKHTNIRTHKHTYSHTHIHTYIRMYIHTYVHTYTVVHTYIHIAQSINVHKRLYSSTPNNSPRKYMDCTRQPQIILHMMAQSFTRLRSRLRSLFNGCVQRLRWKECAILLVSQCLPVSGGEHEVSSWAQQLSEWQQLRWM